MTTSRPQTEIAKQTRTNRRFTGPDGDGKRARPASRAGCPSLASDFGVPPDAFAAAAWHAYLHASPALAEHIEQLQFMAGIEGIAQTPADWAKRSYRFCGPWKNATRGRRISRFAPQTPVR